MDLVRYVARRLFLGVFVLLGLTVLVFVLTRGLSTVDPVVLYVTLDTPPEMYDEIRARHGLNRPLPEQYLAYLRDLSRGELGYSRSAGAPVSTVIKALVPATLELGLAAFLFTVVIGVPLGVWAAYRRGTWADRLARAAALLSVSTPSFWFGLLCQLVFFYWLQQQGLPHLPSSGRISPELVGVRGLGQITGFYLIDSLLLGEPAFFWDSLRHLMLPAFTLGLFPCGLVFSVTRSNTIAVLEREFITFARSKGLRGWRFTWRHVLKNALIPVVTTLGLVVGRLIGGSVIVENVFAWPGLGQWASQSILTTDVASVMGFTLFVTMAFVLINLLVDLGYAYLDPRIRY